MAAWYTQCIQQCNQSAYSSASTNLPFMQVNEVQCIQCNHFSTTHIRAGAHAHRQPSMSEFGCTVCTDPIRPAKTAGFDCTACLHLAALLYALPGAKRTETDIAP